MKTILIILLATCSQHIFALHIRDVSITNSPQNTIYISLNTEAVELYYYHSWQYHIINNKIAVEVFFIPGFGSIISPLNNHFDLPIPTTAPTTYLISVQVYYTNIQCSFLELQDGFKTRFTTRRSHTTNFLKPFSEEVYMPFPNPCNGILFIPQAEMFWIYDGLGRLVKRERFQEKADLNNLPNGLYIARYFNGEKYNTVKIMLRKE